MKRSPIPYLIAAIVGAIILLWVWRAIRSR